MSELAESESCQQVGELRRRRWRSACNFIATDAREQYTAAAGSHVLNEAFRSPSRTLAGAGSHHELFRVTPKSQRVVSTDVYVATGSAALLFDRSKIVTLIPVGFVIAIVGDGVEHRDVGSSAGNDSVSDADDGGGVHAAAQLGNYWNIGTKSALDGCGEGGAKMFFILSVGAIANILARIKIPVFSDRGPSVADGYQARGRHRVNAHIGCQMDRREGR